MALLIGFCFRNYFFCSCSLETIKNLFYGIVSHPAFFYLPYFTGNFQLCLHVCSCNSRLGCIDCQCSFNSVFCYSNLSVFITRNIVGGIDEKVKNQTIFIRFLSVELETMAAKSTDQAISAELSK